jgi:hypothetical protein
MTESPDASSLPRDAVDAQHLLAVLALGLAFATLLVGVAGSDERLLVQNVPLSSVLFLAALGIALCTPCIPSTHSTVLLLLLPVALLGVTLPFSLDQDAGAHKLLNLLVSAFVASVLLAAALQRIGTEASLRALLVMLTLLLAGAVVYKLRYGFFDRQVLFLMNGPIVFARLMGIGCLCSLVTLRGPLRVILALIFFLAVLWTASKGPILALVFALAAYVLFLGSRKERLVFVSLLTAIVVGVAANYEFLSSWQPMSRVFFAINALSAVGGTETDSVGSRVLLLRESLDLVRNHPWGVGVGGWSLATGIRWAEYPHNFVLELWNEGGILLGTAAALPYLAFLLRRIDVWWILCLFFLLCQQVSGDLLDSRYWLAFSIVGFLCRSEGAPIPAGRTGPSGPMMPASLHGEPA